MPATLTIEAENTGQLFDQLRGAASVFLVAEAAVQQARTATAVQQAQAAAAGPPALVADLTAVPYEVLLNEAMARAAKRGFVLTLTQMDTGPEAGPINDPRQVQAPLDDVSGGGDADVSKDADPEAQDAPPVTAPTQPEVDEAKTRQKAIDLLMQVYARGKDGQAACRKAREQLGVKKFADVPLSQAAQLLALAEAADRDVPAAAAG